MLTLFGCQKGPIYRVDYGGQKESFDNARDAYRAGEQVELYYRFIATDTDYSFYLDDEQLNPSYAEDKGFIIRFTMPEHDVRLRCESRNTMIEMPPEEEVMLVDYYHAIVATVGGDQHDELVLYRTADGIRLDAYHGTPNTEETCVSRIVPEEAVTRCYEVIDRYDWRHIQEQETIGGMTGTVTVCKFRDNDGSYVRLSTEEMTDTMMDGMNEIAAILQSYCS
ncbi:MAG: hypothetical protein IJU16_06205 [Clostridia bacterium]|nr:hypothetical protein [Clostridia bacterium]